MVSACAAALLTLAPVATSLVPNTLVQAADAGSATGKQSSASGVTDDKTNSSDAKKSDDSTNKEADDSTSDDKKADSSASSDEAQDKNRITISNIKIDAGTPDFTPVARINDVSLVDFAKGFTVNHLNPIANIYPTKEDAQNVIKHNMADPTTSIKDDQELKAGKTYYEVAEVVLNAPKPNTEYKIDNGIEVNTYKSDENGNLTVPVVYTITAQEPAGDKSDDKDEETDQTKDKSNSSTDNKSDDKTDSKSDNKTDDNKSAQPFFANSNNVAYVNNQTINAPEDLKDPSDSTGATVLMPTSLKNIAAIINGMKLKAYSGSAEGENILKPVTEQEVSEQLKKAGITPSANGDVSIPASGFTYQLTVKNDTSNKSATLNIFFKTTASNYNAYPLIKMGKLNVMQGLNNFNENPVAFVKLHDKDWKQNVLKQFKAQESSANQTAIEIKDTDLVVANMNIDHTGLYPATLKVTNKDGRSTYLAFNIGVQGSEKDEFLTKIAVNRDNHLAKTIHAYSIDGTKVTELKDKTFAINSKVQVYNDTETVNGVKYYRVVINGTERTKTNEWIRADQLSDTPQKLADQGVVKKLMHAAYLYDANGKRVGKTVLRSYSYLPVVYSSVKIGKHEFYKIANSENYIKVGNIDPSLRELTHNAYIYNNRGHVKTVKKTVTVRNKRGKRVKATRHLKLYYSAKKANKTVQTYGARFTIKVGKKEYKMYRVGYNSYVKAANLKLIKSADQNAAKSALTKQGLSQKQIDEINAAITSKNVSQDQINQMINQFAGNNKSVASSDSNAASSNSDSKTADTKENTDNQNK